MSNKPKERTEARRGKPCGARFTDDEIGAMAEALGMEPGEIPDATVVSTFVRRQLRGKRRASR